MLHSSYLTFHGLNLANVYFLQNGTPGKRRGPRVDEEFEWAVFQYCVVALYKVGLNKATTKRASEQQTVEIVANTIYSYRVVRHAAEQVRDLQEFDPVTKEPYFKFKHRPLVENLDFSDKYVAFMELIHHAKCDKILSSDLFILSERFFRWVRNWMRRVGLRRRRVTSVIDADIPPADEVLFLCKHCSVHDCMSMRVSSSFSIYVFAYRVYVLI